MAAEIHKNDIGTTFRITIKDEDDAVVDLSSATTKEILFLKPSGSLLRKTASLYTDGTDGKIQYTTVSGDLDTIGKWRLQSYIVTGGNYWHSDLYKFHVYENIG
jgi:hypothetical protein